MKHYVANNSTIKGRPCITINYSLSIRGEQLAKLRGARIRSAIRQFTLFLVWSLFCWPTKDLFGKCAQRSVFYNIYGKIIHLYDYRLPS